MQNQFMMGTTEFNRVQQNAFFALIACHVVYVYVCSLRALGSLLCYSITEEKTAGSRGHIFTLTFLR